jgi:SPP1 family phage portal protein
VRRQTPNGVGQRRNSVDINKEVKAREESEQVAYFKFGDDYYIGRNTQIMERIKQVYLGALGVTENPFGSNHKLPSGHFKKIVDQKVLYLLGEGVQFSEEGQTEALDPYFETSFDELLIDAGIDASKKSEAWIYGYKDNGKLLFTLIDPQQLTPVYDEFKKLTYMIRTFETSDKTVRLIYDDQNIFRYEKKLRDTKYKLVSTTGHYAETEQFNGAIVGDPIQHGFGEVPFIPLFNNRDHKSDLYNIKSLIDVYDLIMSDFANNIDDFQDAFFTLKGHSGDPKDLAEFMRQLKLIKAVPVAEDGDVGINQLEVPVLARQTFLDLLTKDIYKFAMGVDLSNIQGGSLTNVYIKSMYSDLDLKCNMFENEVRKFIYKVIDFINAHDGKSFTQDFNFTRSMIVNRSEMIDDVLKLAGIISRETIRELIPFEVDGDQEKERLAEENGEVVLT